MSETGEKTEYRIERDSIGEIEVPMSHSWGAQTQRSLVNFKIGEEKMPKDVITAFAYLKKACASANAIFDVIEQEKADAIMRACDEILAG